MRRKKVGGFNLLEVIIGAIILTTVCFAVGAIWVQHQRAYLQTRNRLAADFLLQNEMEKIIAGGFVTLEILAAEPPSTIEVSRVADGVESVMTYQSEITMMSNSNDSLRKAVVAISFSEQGEEPVTISAETDIFYAQ